MNQKFPAAGVGLRLFALVTVISISVFTVANASTESNTPASKTGRPVSTALLQKLNQASHTALAADISRVSNPLKSISGTSGLAGDKPVVLYMGAEFCPYCASLRWPLVLALLRFGHFEGLRYMRSSSTDVHPDTPTFSFVGASYHSDYLAFQSVELADRKGNRLEKADPEQTAVFKHFNRRGGIPFLYIGGQYVESGSPYSPALLKGRSWQQVAARLGNAKTKLNRQVMGAANLYTVAICKLTENRPPAVCSASGVRAARALLWHPPLLLP